MLDFANLDDLQERARACLEPAVFDYLAGGAGDEWTLGENRAAWQRLMLLPRVLRGAAGVRLETTVLGVPVSMPVLVAPMAFHGLCDPDAEVATARGAAASGTVLVASTMSNGPIEASAASSLPGHCWLQLYIHRDRGITEQLVQRAEAAGCSVLCLTVDTPRMGYRERDRRNRFRLPPHLTLGNLSPEHGAMHHEDAGSSAVAQYARDQLDPALTWADVEWLRSLTSLPIVVKGVLHPDDARLATDHGAAGVIVSNHGGRQLDGVPASIVMLERVTNAVAGRAEVLLDGGVRRGTDVLKALALGARAVLLGRPVLWGLAVGGSQGVHQVLEHLRGELTLAMLLAGCHTVDDIGRELVV